MPLFPQTRFSPHLIVATTGTQLFAGCAIILHAKVNKSAHYVQQLSITVPSVLPTNSPLPPHDFAISLKTQAAVRAEVHTRCSPTSPSLAMQMLRNSLGLWPILCKGPPRLFAACRGYQNLFGGERENKHENAV